MVRRHMLLSFVIVASLVGWPSAVGAQVPSNTPKRWWISPVITTPDGLGRVPKVGLIHDPSKPPHVTEDDDGNPITIYPVYDFGAAISSGLPGQANDWCLVVVTSTDFSGLSADSQMIDVLDGFEYVNVSALDQTPAQLGWPTARVNVLRGRLQERGAPVISPTETFGANTPLKVWLRNLGKRVSGSFTVGSIGG